MAPYIRSAKEIGQHYNDEGLTFALLNDLRKFGAGGCFSRLECNVKSHKGRGDVGVRAIHSAVSHPMLPGMKWIASVLKPYVARLPHILRDSDHLIEQLALIKVPHDAKIVTYDISDFFMSGEHPELVRECGSIIEDEDKRRLFKNMLRVIISNQFVVIKGVPRRTWQVRRGTGMGLCCSGALSDVAFYKMAEQLWAVDPSVMRAHHVLYYGRFKDDAIIIAAGTAELRRQYIWGIQDRARFFKITDITVAALSTEMLDITLYRGARWKATGVLDHTLYTKVSSQKVPLAPTSAHAPCVHKAWPQGQISRFYRRCSDCGDVRRCINEFKRDMIHRYGAATFLDLANPMIAFDNCQLIIPGPSRALSFHIGLNGGALGSLLYCVPLTVIERRGERRPEPGGVSQSVTPSVCLSRRQSVTHSAPQSFQSISQSVSRSVSHTVSRSVGQSVSQADRQPVSPSVQCSAVQSVSQSPLQINASQIQTTITPPTLQVDSSQIQTRVVL